MKTQIFCFKFLYILQDDNYVPVMKDSNVDVKALSNAYREKKKIRDDSNVVKIGKKQKLFLNLLKQITMTCSLDSTY